MISATLAALTLQTGLVKYDPIPFTDVTIRDRFWQPRQETNRTATVQQCLTQLDDAGNYLVMRLAAEGKRTGYKGLIFTDSDLYKVLEGVSYTLATHPNPDLDKRADELIALIASAQMKDGYINTWHQVNAPDRLWKNLRDEHELYCAGHMIEAAVAHHKATGKKNFLDIALRFANLIDQRYGPSGQPGYPGHPELELALVKLWKDTGDDRWLALTKKMIETRGTHFFAMEHNTPEARYDGTYWLDDVPIREHKEIKGHAVRAAYLLTGAADLARETHDAEMIKMLNRVWRNATEKRVFITGGIGPSGSNEGFTVDYDLPTLSAYQETCASIAMALWGQRMALLFGDAKYVDSVEMALYNGMLSGISLDGKSFFYVNPLASRGTHHRAPWFTCACCPPNVLRTIASLGDYVYARSKNELVVNLYVGGDLNTTVGNEPLKLQVKTDYPWDGKVAMTFAAPSRAGLRLRNPGWAQGASLMVNGKKQSEPKMDKGYFVLAGPWKQGDTVTLDLPMPAMQMEAHPGAKDDRGRAAVQRGPLIYCAEQVDNSAPVEELVLPRGTSLKPTYRKDVLGGVVVIEAEGQAVPSPDWDRKLYQPLQAAKKAKATLIPYGYWDNRKAGPMEVWLPLVPPLAKITGPEGKAKVSLSFRSGNAQPWGINDGLEVAKSDEQPAALLHFWPHKGGEEWVQYTWDKPQTITGSKIFWFDDTGRGECRLPKDFKLQALVNGQWTDLALKGKAIAMDKWTDLTFPAITSTALRVVIQQKEGWASGIHEWKVIQEE
ncbi:MAG: glycoside hydrolase family 127 protein [Fimbriimonas sp.]